VDAFSRIVRLGEGTGGNGVLGETAMARAIEALKVCGAKLAQRQVARARLIATEACRTAVNGPEFVERVRVEAGLTLEIVSREAEARLAVAGCASLVDPLAAGVILFDIGGGSSELVWIDLGPHPDGRRRRMADRIRAWMSLPVGVVNVSERHGGRHVTPAQFTAMVDEVAGMLDDFPEAGALDVAVAAGGVHMLGTSGTVTTLAGVHLGLPRYDRRRVDGTWLTGAQVEDLVGALVAMDYEARVANPCIGRERADLVLAGCAILEAFRRRWPCERMRVADRGLREGILVELMAEDGVWRPRGRGRAADRFHGSA
jgi:exopolyphosphatase/guanosine-5'-triphosphate,3'-diphosphate pyrophosphatase